MQTVDGGGLFVIAVGLFVCLFVWRKFKDKERRTEL